MLLKNDENVIISPNMAAQKYNELKTQNIECCRIESNFMINGKEIKMKKQ